MAAQNEVLSSDSFLREEVLAWWVQRVESIVGLDEGASTAELFERCLRRTLDQTLVPTDEGTAVITGDIPAMWLRDSSTQMWPYLTFAAKDPHGRVADLVASISSRQLAFIVHDPYANAFNVRSEGTEHTDDDWGEQAPDPAIWERKYEVDSLCFPLQLLARLVEVTERPSLIPETFPEAARAIIKVLSQERRHAEVSGYAFQRPNSWHLDNLPNNGHGSATKFTGMTWSGFRPSDDACTYGFNVPANLLAASALRDTSYLCQQWIEAGRSSPQDVQACAEDACALADGLEEAVGSAGCVETADFGQIWAYEVDGRGNSLLMDDANLPSLLSLPLLADVSLRSPLYQRTRHFVLSPANPYWYRGTDLEGVGSPHTFEGWVWPIAVATQGLTSLDAKEALDCLREIVGTTAGTQHIHESICANNPAEFTRPWFSWADAMFCLLAMNLAAPGEVVLPGRQADIGRWA